MSTQGSGSVAASITIRTTATHCSRTERSGVTNHNLNRSKPPKSHGGPSESSSAPGERSPPPSTASRASSLSTIATDYNAATNPRPPHHDDPAAQPGGIDMNGATSSIGAQFSYQPDYLPPRAAPAPVPEVVTRQAASAGDEDILDHAGHHISSTFFQPVGNAGSSHAETVAGTVQEVAQRREDMDRARYEAYPALQDEDDSVLFRR